jgi:hypothetical protein
LSWWVRESRRDNRLALRAAPLLSAKEVLSSNVAPERPMGNSLVLLNYPNYLEYGDEQ